MPKTVTNLVIQGGGICAIAYTGFFKTVYEKNIFSLAEIKRIAGVSSGTIVGLFLALGFTPEEMLTHLQEIDFTKFSASTSGMDKQALYYFSENNLYKDEYLYGYISHLLQEKTGNAQLTFQDLQALKKQYPYKDFYILSTKLYLRNDQPHAQPFIFSHEHTPFARVADAIRASMSLPIIYPPMRLLEDKDGHYIIHSSGHVFIDGGMIETHPIRLFDYPHYMNQRYSTNMIENAETLGLTLDISAEIAALRDNNSPPDEQIIKTNFAYARAIFYVFRNTQQLTNLKNSLDARRTVFIETAGVSSTQFNLTFAQRNALIKAGENAANRLLETSK